MYKNKKTRKTYLPDILRPNEVRNILRMLGIVWQQHKVNNRGWVVICSPLKTDKKPSFSINVNHGCFTDHADPTIKGDIIKLVTLMKGYNYTLSEKWVNDSLNLNLILN